MNKIVIVGGDSTLISKIKDILDLDIEIIDIEELKKEDNKMNLLSICDYRKILDFYVEKNIYEPTKISKKNIKSESHKVKTKTKDYKRRITYDKGRY